MCFTVQLSRFLSFFLSATAFILISKLFLFVKNFFNFFQSFLLLSSFLTFCYFYFSNSFILSSFQLFVKQLFLFTDNIVKVLYFLCHLSATTLILYHSCTPSVNIFFIFFTQKETLKNGNAFFKSFFYYYSILVFAYQPLIPD